MPLKCLVKKGNKFIVEAEDKELAQYLTKKLLEGKREGVEVEWVYSYESPLVKPLMGKQWTQWVFGVCVKEIGLIHVFLDNILKGYVVSGFEPIEHWFAIESTKHLVHELIHFLAPEWTESQVENATEKVMEAWLSPLRDVRLVIHIGNKKFEHLLTGDNRVLEVKP